MTNNLLWEKEDSAFLKVLVRPNSGERELIHSLSETELIVNLKSPAREGKANTELIKRMSKALSVSSSDLVIVSGHKGREKTLKITGMKAVDVWSTLSMLHKR